jgi:hypothetical protein
MIWIEAGVFLVIGLAMYVRDRRREMKGKEKWVNGRRANG